MKRFTLYVTLLALLGLSGCFPTTLHSLYTEDDLIFDQALIGTWGEKGDDETIVFKKSGPHAYTMIHIEDSVETEFSAHLLKIGEELFLDLFPEDPRGGLSDVFEWHIIGMHSFFHVQQIEPVLKLSPIDPDWLKNHFATNPGSTAHAIIEHRIILTAPTTDLQAFVLKHLHTEGAFGEASEFNRMDD